MKCSDCGKAEATTEIFDTSGFTARCNDCQKANEEEVTSFSSPPQASDPTE